MPSRSWYLRIVNKYEFRLKTIFGGLATLLIMVAETGLQRTGFWENYPRKVTEKEKLQEQYVLVASVTNLQGLKKQTNKEKT